MCEDDGREAAPTPRIIRESDARALPRREQPTRMAPAEAALEASVRGVRRKRRRQTQATQTLANACLRARTASTWSWRATTQATQATQATQLTARTPWRKDHDLLEMGYIYAGIVGVA